MAGIARTGETRPICQPVGKGEFRSLRAFCLSLFAGGGFSGEDIVHIAAGHAAEGLPDISEVGVRVAFTLTYAGMGKLDGPTRPALERLILADLDDA